MYFACFSSLIRSPARPRRSLPVFAVLAVLLGACAQSPAPKSDSGGARISALRGPAGFSAAGAVNRYAAPRGVVLAAAAGHARHRKGLFGYTEVRSSNVGAFTRVHRALADTFGEVAQDPGCRTSIWRRCPVASWQKLLAGLKGSDRRDQIEAVNRFVNRARYVTDARNYGVADRWTSASELFERGGDCEEYVLTKYVSLRALGVPVHDMRISVVYDRVRRMGHAVLIVELNGRTLVLDNQVGGVLPAEQVTRYRPLYSINEASLWLHTTPLEQQPAQDAAARPARPRGNG
jgi:predicted transglutaminase-like cysteine proteinase